jgi:hypothetical protein
MDNATVLIPSSVLYHLRSLSEKGRGELSKPSETCASLSLSPPCHSLESAYYVAAAPGLGTNHNCTVDQSPTLLVDKPLMGVDETISSVGS